jgi:hypothetical protein
MYMKKMESFLVFISNTCGKLGAVFFVHTSQTNK